MIYSTVYSDSGRPNSLTSNRTSPHGTTKLNKTDNDPPTRADQKDPLFLQRQDLTASALTVAIMTVLQFPPRLSRNTEVIIELR